MEHIRKQIALLQFKGPRFEDHGLDVDVLPELIAYKRLLQETAKEIWRRRNPDRQRLPKNFGDGITLKFFELRPGSTGVPLVRDLPLDTADRLPLFEDELEDELEASAIVLKEAIASAGSGSVMPAALPRSVVPFFEQFGQTLRSDEFLLVSSGTNSETARYDSEIKRSILAWTARTYVDSVDLVGEVRAADLDGQRFTLRLADGRKVPGRFDVQQEFSILNALEEHLSIRLRVVGVGVFTNEDGALREISSVERVGSLNSDSPAGIETPIWEEIAAISASVPADAWQNIPSDLASNVDKYLYRGKGRP